MMIKLKKHIEDGMTLMEVVLAVTILTFIISIAYRSIAKITESKTLLDEERELFAVGNALYNRLSSELSQVGTTANLLPFDGTTAYPSNFHLLGKSRNIGGERGDVISFIADNAGQFIPDGGSNAGLVVIRYRMEKNPEQENGNEKTFLLIRDEMPHNDNVKLAQQRIMTFPISDRVTTLKFQYFDNASKDWQEEWSETQNYIPALVKFTIGLSSEKGREVLFSTVIFIGT